MIDTTAQTPATGGVPRLVPSPTIEIYHKTWCSYSRAALALLRDKGVPFVDLDVTENAELEREMVRRSGRTSVPEIFVDDELIGGFDELQALEDHGLLDGLLGVGGDLGSAT